MNFGQEGEPTNHAGEYYDFIGKIKDINQRGEIYRTKRFCLTRRVLPSTPVEPWPYWERVARRKHDCLLESDLAGKNPLYLAERKSRIPRIGNVSKEMTLFNK